MLYLLFCSILFYSILFSFLLCTCRSMRLLCFVWMRSVRSELKAERWLQAAGREANTKINSCFKIDVSLWKSRCAFKLFGLFLSAADSPTQKSISQSLWIRLSECNLCMDFCSLAQEIIQIGSVSPPVWSQQEVLLALDMMRKWWLINTWNGFLWVLHHLIQRSRHVETIQPWANQRKIASEPFKWLLHACESYNCSGYVKILQ